MNVHICYKVHKTPDIEKEIQHHLQKLQKRLQVFRPELVHLKGIMEQSSPREGIAVSLNLRLPSGQMAAQKSAPAAAAALKAAFEDLLQQLNKHKALLRSTHKWPRWRGGNEGRPEPQVPFEDTIAAVRAPLVSADDIRSYVNANLGHLQRFVERELYFREAAEQIAPESVTKDEVIDEVIARALSDGGDKPERLALEPWLYRLALLAMDELGAPGQENGSGVPLEQSARKPNVRASDEPELQFHQPDEMLTGENVIPDRRASTPEDIACSDEMVALVQFALSAAEPADREAFILHAIEGFSADEIAAITDRPLEQVRSSITVARDHLRRSLPLAARVKEKPLRTVVNG
jgi:DNA-directed RNA polymerase specialized sigma24 family protein/ribosome-associated translation inhibitor RaiA